MPLELFSSKGIGCIVSAVGKPFYLDKATEECRRVFFARVCVEASNEESLPQVTEVEIEGVGLISVRVEYPWGSRVCSICKAFDHYAKDCRKKQQSWVPVGKVDAAMASKAENTSGTSQPTSSAPSQPTSSVPSQSTSAPSQPTSSVPSQSTSAPSQCEDDAVADKSEHIYEGGGILSLRSLYHRVLGRGAKLQQS